MSDNFEVWDLTSRNILGVYPSEDTALKAIRTALQEHGPSYAEDLALIREDKCGESQLLAQGPELAQRAIAPSSHLPSLPSGSTP
jgi:hypothetical protein